VQLVGGFMVSEMQFALSPKPSMQHRLVIVFMVACFALATWLTPHLSWYEHIGSPQFEQVVPKNFGDWIEVTEANNSTVVNPEVQEAVNNLYTQVVSRVYEQKSTGRRIILSLAYGDNQTFSKQLHRPESCYSSQGFKISNLYEEKINAINRPLMVNRMSANIGSRVEQVTYWIRIGDRLISGPPTALNMARLKMGLKGYITDGLLFRVSELSDDSKLSYLFQDQFINDFLSAFGPEQKAMMIGSLAI
jgi:EpsI family protein